MGIYESEQTKHFLNVIENDIKKQTAKMRFVQLQSERKARLAVLRERALKALQAVQNDPGIPELVKDGLHAAGENILMGKDLVDARRIINRLKKAIQ